MEKKILSVYTIYGHDGHISHVTKNILINLCLFSKGGLAKNCLAERFQKDVRKIMSIHIYGHVA